MGGHFCCWALPCTNWFTILACKRISFLQCSSFSQVWESKSSFWRGWRDCVPKLDAIKFYKCVNFCLSFVVALDNMGLYNKDLTPLECWILSYGIYVGNYCSQNQIAIWIEWQYWSKASMITVNKLSKKAWTSTASQKEGSIHGG
jgi:hypothetical protein